MQSNLQASTDSNLPIALFSAYTHLIGREQLAAALASVDLCRNLIDMLVYRLTLGTHRYLFSEQQERAEINQLCKRLTATLPTSQLCNVLEILMENMNACCEQNKQQLEHYRQE